MKQMGLKDESTVGLSLYIEVNVTCDSVMLSQVHPSIAIEMTMSGKLGNCPNPNPICKYLAPCAYFTS